MFEINAKIFYTNPKIFSINQKFFSINFNFLIIFKKIKIHLFPILSQDFGTNELYYTFSSIKIY